MDIEDLNKTQMILLTLLLSFVTSMATGIITVSLMNQTPPIITQTIHKVVEKTIEKVTANDANDEKKVVENVNQNFISDIVEKNSESIVRIIQKTEEGNIFSGFGVLVDKKGILVTSEKNILPKANYYALIGDKKFDLEFLKNNSIKQVDYFKLSNFSNTAPKSTIFKTVTYSKYDDLKLGQPITALGGVSSTEVATGIISGFLQEKTTEQTGATGSPATDIKLINYGVKTNIPTSAIITGAPLFDSEGKIIGINIDSDKNTYIFLGFIREDLQSIITKLETID